MARYIQGMSLSHSCNIDAGDQQDDEDADAVPTPAFATRHGLIGHWATDSGPVSMEALKARLPGADGAFVVKAPATTVAEALAGLHFSLSFLQEITYSYQLLLAYKLWHVMVV